MKLVLSIIALIMLLTLGVYSAIHLFVSPLLMIGMIIYSTIFIYMVAKDMTIKKEVS